jgi:protein SCO1
MKHAILVILLAVLPAPALAPAQPSPKVGVEEQLGKTISLDQLTFRDEAGKPVTLRSLFDRPVVLTLVYFHCPGICSPLLNELARVADSSDLTPGVDYRIITISFDPKETYELAARKREAMLGQMSAKKPPPDAWRFLTGEEGNIQRLADEVGFRFIPDRNGSDFVHPATIIFLSSEGKVVRYLNGLKFSAAEMELAVGDSRTGRQRSFIQTVQQLCYAYDPAAQRHTLRIDRIILAVTVPFALALVVYSVRQGRARRRLGCHGCDVQQPCGTGGPGNTPLGDVAPATEALRSEGMARQQAGSPSPPPEGGTSPGGRGVKGQGVKEPSP